MISADSDPRTWCRLTTGEQAALRSAGYTRTWPARATIVPQGSPPRSMYVLLLGFVKIMITNSRGEQAPIAARGPGDIVGELAPISDRPRIATMLTITPVNAIVIPRDRARSVIRDHPHIAEELLHTAAIRLQQSDRLRLESGGPDFTQRLAAVLLELAHQCAPTAPLNTRVDLPFPQEELAAFARVSRSTLIRGLDELRRLHLVQTSRRGTTIVSLQTLGDYAETDNP